MNPIKISQQLQRTLVHYLMTTFDVNRDGSEPELAAMVRRSLNTPGALFNGPFLELTPPYRTGKSLHALIDAGILSSGLQSLPCFAGGRPIPLHAPLYTHQELAIRNLSEQQRGVVVSSGTGSGKTECFLIPILNDLLLDETPGVRALMVYPMNALVNDQLDRLRSLLAGTPITFGRYTSELEQTEKEALKKLGFEPLPNEVICRDDIQYGTRIPQILITNYAMLEYLLLRPEDAKLFAGGLWRFLVLDEAHTYTGAQGVEVAILIRRLKHRLGKQQGEMRCVATSATLTDNRADAAAEFATRLFGEDFQIADVIFGEINPEFAPKVEELANTDAEAYLHDGFDELLRVTRTEETSDVADIALRLNEVGLISDEKVTWADQSNQNGPSFLWRALQDNPHLVQLRDWMLQNGDRPVRPDDAARHIFGGTFQDNESRLHALYHLVELGTLARPAPDQPPLLPARYHLFMRAPQGMWACINPRCAGRETSSDAAWSRLFSHQIEGCDACGCQIYPLSICRECGQVFVHMHEENSHLRPAQKPEPMNGESRYFTWRAIRENIALGPEMDEDEQPHREPSKLQQSEIRLCVRCAQNSAVCRCPSPEWVQLW